MAHMENCSQIIPARQGEDKQRLDRIRKSLECQVKNCEHQRAIEGFRFGEGAVCVVELVSKRASGALCEKVLEGTGWR